MDDPTVCKKVCRAIDACMYIAWSFLIVLLLDASEYSIELLKFQINFNCSPCSTEAIIDYSTVFYKKKVTFYLTDINAVI